MIVPKLGAMNLQELSKEELIVIIERLMQRVSELESRLSQDSSNTSKPPSSDPLWKRSNRKTSNNSKARGRKPGGQKGHKGYKLKKFEHPDKFESHQLSQCSICGSQDLEEQSIVCRQVLDIPEPKFEVTEHQIHQYRCGCCRNKVQGGRSLGLNQEIQYGQRLKGLVSYLNVYQLIPYKRLTEVVYHLFGIKISQGTISNFNKELQKGVGSYLESAHQMFISDSRLIHSDETGCMVNKKLHWVHVYSDLLKTLLFGHAKRGKEAMQDIAILDQTKATVIHDRFHSYLTYEDIEHGLCNAHILRELKTIIPNAPNNWPDQIKKLLLEAKKKKAHKPLANRQITRFVNKYESILRKQRSHYQEKENQLIRNNNTRGKPKRSKDHNLFIALWKYRKMILKFITHHSVPFDNNLAERDFRMLKVKMKISNQFKTLEWLNVHNDIRSYVSTAIKQKLNVFDAIYNALVDPKFAANLAV